MFPLHHNFTVLLTYIRNEGQIKCLLHLLVLRKVKYCFLCLASRLGVAPVVHAVATTAQRTRSGARSALLTVLARRAATVLLRRLSVTPVVHAVATTAQRTRSGATLALRIRSAA